MFYSEALLSRTGPLARVWLSANLERKLSKTHILQSDIESSVNAIVDQGTAPMALRLSGQLLLGVVRIYSRKARYLLDDCNEALLKIKMAFRPGNVDLPAELTVPAAGALTLADKISDPLIPELDPSLLDFAPRDAFFAPKKDDPLVWNSQIVPEPSIEIGHDATTRDQRVEFGEDDMNIDLDLDFGLDDGPSIELGRNAPPPLPMDDDLLADDLVSKNLGAEDETRTRLSSQVPSLIGGDDQGLDTGNIMFDDGDNLAVEPHENLNPPTALDDRRPRDSDSPLSSVDSLDFLERDLTHVNIEEPEESSIHQAAQKAKRRKVIQSDAATMLTSEVIKKQQQDRSAILKPMSFLPRDQMLLDLMSLQRKGAFVSSLLGEGPIKGLAPELRGILSIEVVRKSNQLKRKRDPDEVSDAEDENADREPSRVHFDIPEDDTIVRNDENDSVGGDMMAGDAGLVDNPADITASLPDDADLDDEDNMQNQWDETTAPLVAPVDQGPMSQGTQHAVHLFREKFRPLGEGSPSQQKKANLLFQDLLPERATSKADATKMFFETLVLATKDAIKVEQGDKEVGSNIRIRAKRSLWEAWAEKEAGGEIAGQEERESSAVVT